MKFESHVLIASEVAMITNSRDLGEIAVTNLSSSNPLIKKKYHFWSTFAYLNGHSSLPGMKELFIKCTKFLILIQTYAVY